MEEYEVTESLSSRIVAEVDKETMMMMIVMMMMFSMEEDGKRHVRSTRNCTRVNHRKFN